VYWGITSATGRLSNNHDICIKKLVFAEATTLPNDGGLFLNSKSIIAENNK